MKKTLFWVSLALCTVASIISVSCWAVARSTNNNYLAPIEVVYAGENIIQNSEGQIYEYEYRFKTEEGGIVFLHLNEPQTFQQEDAIRYKRGDTSDFSLDSEIQREIMKLINESIVWRNIAIILGICSSLIAFLILMSYLRQKRLKKEEDKKYRLWQEDIPNVMSYISDHSEWYKKINPLLRRISSLIMELDRYYENSKSEKDYRSKGLRKEIETIINLYLKNIEIDKQFKDSIISPEINEEFYRNLERINSYIDSEIRKLTKPNDDLIKRQFDTINSMAELDNKVTDYLKAKYEK